MIIEVKEFLVTNRYDTNSPIVIDEKQYVVLECNQYVLPKFVTQKSCFVVKCVEADLVKQI